MNLLITSAGKRVSLVKAFQKELKSMYPDGKVMACDAFPEMAAACQVADKAFRVPRLSEPSYVKNLIENCVKHEIKVIIPTIDTELLILSESKELFETAGLKLVLSSSDLIEKCRDKRLIHEFFNAKGVRVAEEYDADNLKFPLFIKPSNGSRSVDTFFIKSEEDLVDYHFQNKNFMFLEYIDHSVNDEYTCDTYYGRDNKLKCVVPRRRIAVRDGEVNKGKTEKNILVEYIKKHLGKIEGARGCLTIQFFLNRIDKSIVAIEINPRFGGGYPLSYLAGANFPKWVLEEYILGKEVSYFEDWENNVLMLRYDHEVIIKDYEG